MDRNPAFAAVLSGLVLGAACCLVIATVIVLRA